MELSIEKGYAEKVPDHELQGTTGRKWYLPDHGVMHSQKDKIRVVYDCSAQYKGTSLNQELLKGPDLANNLVGVLTRFREGKVPLTSDIEGMFSQVVVPEEGRDFSRLLWWEDGNVERPPSEYRMRVHVFGAISSPSCANYALKKTAGQQEELYTKEATTVICHNFYVDDCLWSTRLKNFIESHRPCVSYYRCEHAPTRRYLPSSLAVQSLHTDFKQVTNNKVSYSFF